MRKFILASCLMLSMSAHADDVLVTYVPWLAGIVGEAAASQVNTNNTWGRYASQFIIIGSIAAGERVARNVHDNTPSGDCSNNPYKDDQEMAAAWYDGCWKALEAKRDAALQKAYNAGFDSGRAQH